MRDYDLEFIFAFIKRAGMYTSSNADYGYQGIGTFLYAYEMGSEGKCTFTQPLSKRIEDEYNIKIPGPGLEQQLKLAAKELDIEWYELFKQEAKEVLIEVSDSSGKNRFVSIIRRNIISHLEQIGDKINALWIINWNFTLDQVNDWKGVNIQEDEKELFFNILKQLKIETPKNVDDELPISTELKNKIENLIQLMKNKNHKN
ncbi:MAG: hypothetical protein AB8F94_02195 [Saprospiraceae bacterium]